MGPARPDAETPLRSAIGVGGVPEAWYGVPPLQSGLIERDRLVKGIVESGAPIVEVVAPAGYGKSAALRLCAEADSRPYAWVQLTEADNDPVHLARHVALALDALAPLHPEQMPLVVGAGRSTDLDLFPTLACLFADRSPAVLVLDDLHLLNAPKAIRGVEALLAAVAEGSTLAVLGRHMPVKLGRNRVLGRVQRVAPDDLAMGTVEAAQLFERAGLDLHDGDVRAMVARTEGWPGGLHLASLALARGRTVEEFSGRDRLVAEYLVEEVIEDAGVDVAEFLERSAVLELMDAATVDALLERTDSGRTLAALEAGGNLLLIPLDDEGHRFRYHHLFRDLLLQRLTRSTPVLARRLESRASVLMERAGDPDAALRHAVRAGETERAAALILRSTMPRWFDGRHAQVGEWLALLGDDAVARHPAATIASAWYCVAAGDYDGAARACEAAERFGHHGPLDDGSPSLPVAIAAVRMIMALGGTGEVVREAEVVRAAGGPAANPWWALATGSQASAYAMQGELDLARERMTEALAAAGEAPYLRAAGLAHLALLSLHDDDLAAADRLAGQARRIADEHHLERFLPAVAVYAIGARVAAQLRRADEARASAAIAGSVVVRLGALSPRTTVLTLVLLAQAAQVLGDLDEARRHLGDAQRARRRDGSAAFLNHQIDVLAGQLSTVGAAARGGPQTLTTAELRVLEYLPTHLSLREIAADLHVSRNTAKSHTGAIYRKLGVRTRGDAVAVARELGLVAGRDGLP